MEQKLKNDTYICCCISKSHSLCFHNKYLISKSPSKMECFNFDIQIDWRLKDIFSYFPCHTCTFNGFIEVNNDRWSIINASPTEKIEGVLPGECSQELLTFLFRLNLIYLCLGVSISWKSNIRYWFLSHISKL